MKKRWLPRAVAGSVVLALGLTLAACGGGSSSSSGSGSFTVLVYGDASNKVEKQIIDTFNKINVPFVLDFDKRRGKYIMTCKTALKRPNFATKPSDHVIALRGK